MISFHMPRKGRRLPNYFPPICFQYIECKLRCHHFPTFWWRAVWLFAIVWLWWMIQLHIGLITKCKQSAKLNLQIEWQCLLNNYRHTHFEGLLILLVPIFKWLVPILKSLVPIFKELVPIFKGSVPIFKWVVPIFKGLVPILKGVRRGEIEEKLVVVSSISMELPKSVQQKEQIVACNLFRRKDYKIH